MTITKIVAPSKSYKRPTLSPFGGEKRVLAVEHCSTRSLWNIVEHSVEHCETCGTLEKGQKHQGFSYSDRAWESDI